MSKSNSNWNAVAIGFISIFIGLVSFAFTQSIFNLFFVPLIIYVLWSHTDRVNRLEAKLLEIEVLLNHEKQKERV